MSSWRPIELLVILPYCSHNPQRLYASVFSPVKRAFTPDTNAIVRLDTDRYLVESGPRRTFGQGESFHFYEHQE